MAYGLSLDILFFDDDNSEPDFSMLDDLDEFEDVGGGLFRSRIDGTTAVKSSFSEVMLANVYSFNIPGDMAAVELLQRLVGSDRQALVGVTPLDSTGPNTILLVTDPADYAARMAEHERVFLVLDNKLQDPAGFVAALRVIEQGPTIEDEIEGDIPENPESISVIVPAPLLTTYSGLKEQVVATNRRFFVGSSQLNQEALTLAVFAALGISSYSLDIEEGDTFYAYAEDEGDDSSSSIAVASVINLPKLAWMGGMNGFVEVMISTEKGSATTDQTALEEWAATFGLCVAEASAEGTDRLHLKGLVNTSDGATNEVSEVIDMSTVWEN